MVWALQVYYVACLERPSRDGKGVWKLLSSTLIAPLKILQNTFGHVSKVIPKKLKMSANQEGLGLVCIQIKSYKRKRCMSYSQRKGPPSPLKEKERRTPNSLTRTRRRKRTRTQAEKKKEQEPRCKRNRKTRERGPILPIEKEIYFKRDGFQSWLLRRVHQIQAGFV